MHKEWSDWGFHKTWGMKFEFLTMACSIGYSSLLLEVIQDMRTILSTWIVKKKTTCDKLPIIIRAVVQPCSRHSCVLLLVLFVSLQFCEPE